MNTQYNLRVLGIGSLLTLLFCAGIFFYARWDNQRFVSELPQLPNFEVTSQTVEQREMIRKELPGLDPPAEAVEPQRLEGQHIATEVPDMEAEKLVLEETEMSELDLEVDPLSVSTVELPEISEENLLETTDFRRTKEAWQDYNDLLAVDSSSAYTRLAEGFREMYGDHPEIDIIVESIKRANERTLTVDDAIAMVTSTLKIMPADQTIVIDQMSEKLELLYELKAFQAEGGKATVTFNISVGEK
ncbi:MAG: hypothetical protein OXN25_03720 [Candidatus Poribacteria bacterium]|nr:hypothetical protein [Candidatus Poribacteria bacterium]